MPSPFFVKGDRVRRFNGTEATVTEDEIGGTIQVQYDDPQIVRPMLQVAANFEKITSAPPLPVPPKFASVEEAEAWLEANA